MWLDCRLHFKMVCMPGHFKMTSVLKLVMMENHTAPDDVIHEMTTAQVLQKQLFDAHEPNLLDENGKLPLLIFQLFSLVSSTKGPGGTGRFFSATSFWLICVCVCVCVCVFLLA